MAAAAATSLHNEPVAPVGVAGTVRQVESLLSSSGCSMTEFMHRAWSSRSGRLDEHPLPLGWNKETYPSHCHSEDLKKKKKGKSMRQPNCGKQPG